MKRIVSSFLAVLFVMIVCSVADHAFATSLPGFQSEASASSRILIYHQATTAQASWQEKKLGSGTCSCGKYFANTYMGVANSNGGKNTCPSCGRSLGWGCGIYAMAHAVQWSSGIAMNSTNGGAFLDEFIATNMYPWKGNLYTDYQSVAAAHGVTTTTIPSSESGLQDFFNQGGAIVTNIPGHYQIAVGIAAGLNGETWIHMVDSTCYSTIWRLNNYNYVAYNFYSGAEQSSSYNYGGGEYWISYSAFKNAFSKIVAFPGMKGNSYSSTFQYNESSTYSANKATNVKSYPYSQNDEHPESVTVAALSSGDQITTVAAYKNSYDNIWFEINAVNGVPTFGYVYAGDFSYIGSNATVDWQDNNLSGTVRKQGESYNLKGAIISSNTIKSITAEFEDDSVCYSPVGVDVNGTSYSLYQSTLDLNLKFGSLPVSDQMKLVFYVTCYTNRKSQTIEITYTSPFRITQDGTISPSRDLTDPVIYNEVYYLQNNPDVAAQNWSSAINAKHWLQDGLPYGRKASPVFDVVFYINSYSDLAAAFGSDYVAAANHFLNCGISETRQASAEFNVQYYKANYKDLEDAYGSDSYQYYLHYVTYGKNEGRIANERLKIFFDSNGGSVEITEQYAQRGAVYGSLPTASRSGYLFDGWYTAANGGTKITSNDIFSPFESQTLYAHWEKKLVTNVTLSDSSFQLDLNQTHILTACIEPADAFSTGLSWTTSNPQVATVSSGRVTPVGIGTAIITCSATDGSGKYATCNITVNDHVIVMDKPVLANKTSDGMGIGFHCSVCNEIIIAPKCVSKNRILSLPSFLLEVCDEAFTSASMQQLVLPNGVIRIGSRAFENCRQLLLISIPDTVTSIADDAFDGCDLQSLCIIANSGSNAARYAQKNGIYLCTEVTP